MAGLMPNAKWQNLAQDNPNPLRLISIEIDLSGLPAVFQAGRLNLNP
ncbi:MAG: hypothetical protein HGA37_12030 [Lentimicrobium sp.]|nr:hypothetical protein [Lentimicrobium sp.]